MIQFYLNNLSIVKDVKHHKVFTTVNQKRKVILKPNNIEYQFEIKLGFIY